MNTDLNETLAASCGFNSITFGSKSDYLLFVAQWKLCYKDLSAHIRKRKRLVKEWQRVAANKQRMTDDERAKLEHEVNSFALSTEIRGAKIPPLNKWWPAHDATIMIALRYATKKIAKAQMEALRARKVY